LHSPTLSIWFFIGVMLVAYGALISGYGVFELVTGKTANVALGYLHAPVWWGILLLTAGLFYCIAYRPGKIDR